MNNQIHYKYLTIQYKIDTILELASYEPAACPGGYEGQRNPDL